MVEDPQLLLGTKSNGHVVWRTERRLSWRPNSIPHNWCGPVRLVETIPCDSSHVVCWGQRNSKQKSTEFIPQTSQKNFLFEYNIRGITRWFPADREFQDPHCSPAVCPDLEVTAALRS